MKLWYARLAVTVAAFGFAAALPAYGQSPASAESAEVQACAALKHRGDPKAPACYQRLTRSSDPLLQGEGFWALGDFKTANDAFRAAVKARPKDPGPRVRWGRLFLDHYQASDAQDLFKEALEINKDYAPALLGMALVAGENYEAQAIQFAEQALKADPKLVEAQEVISRVQLEDNEPEKAAASANKALDIDKESLDSMALLGTIDMLADKKDSPWMIGVFADQSKIR